MPRAFTDREKELIGKQLLDQGYRLFSAYGLKKTNIEEIAKPAGISKGAFYGFYESKEALFMDVVEQVEIRVRQEILAAIPLPGPSSRARLFAVLKLAFGLLKTIPLLQFLTGNDYDVVFRSVPPEKLREHMTADRAFIEELIVCCRDAGILIRAQPQQIIGLLYPIALAILHADDLGRPSFSGNIDMQLELVAAFCLGEIELRLQEQTNHTPDSPGEALYELAD